MRVCLCEDSLLSIFTLLLLESSEFSLNHRTWKECDNRKLRTHTFRQSLTEGRGSPWTMQVRCASFPTPEWTFSASTSISGSSVMKRKMCRERFLTSIVVALMGGKAGAARWWWSEILHVLLRVSSVAHDPSYAPLGADLDHYEYY